MQVQWLRPTTSHTDIRNAAAIVLAVGAMTFAVSPARGFDTGPHADITRDALAAEGFGEVAIQYVQVTNWMVDLYENAEKLPASGHTSFGRYLIGGLGRLENWPNAVWKRADRSHFDATGGGFSPDQAFFEGPSTGFSNVVQLTEEWDGLRRSIGHWALRARANRDPQLLLTLLGISLHQIQDFYSHTNWLEPAGRPGRSGPGWSARQWGSTPTWFDIPPDVRRAENLYAGGSLGVMRTHGGWKDDNNASLERANAKDWPGRPLYTQAHIAAYFATRQWVQALRAHVANAAFWDSARLLSRPPSGLGHDLRGALNISLGTGHWQGQGEPCNPSFDTLSCGDREGPGGTLFDAREAVKQYFSMPRSAVRHRFEQTIKAVRDGSTDRPFNVQSSQAMQRSTTFVQLQITSMREIDNLDAPGAADMFVRARIASQPFISAVINGYDSFGFRRPHKPFTFLKSVQNGARFDAPVASILVRIRTGDMRLAGTNDTVYLRINDAQRFPLDKRLYDDFQRGDDDTYSVPIDDAVARGLRVSDVKYLQIEKAPDGPAGGWRLRGVRVWINDRLVATDDLINRWLENDRRAWRVRGFTPTAPSGPGVPVVMALWEMDALISGADDHTDIHPWDRRRDVVGEYVPDSGERTGTAVGGSRFAGRRGDDKRAALTWRLTTVGVEPSRVGPPPPPPPQALRPDLQITAFDFTKFTVKNTGNATAGPFSVSVDFAGTFAFPRLEPGASVTRAVSSRCVDGRVYRAVADSMSQVFESNETNNIRSFGPVFW